MKSCPACHHKVLYKKNVNQCNAQGNPLTTDDQYTHKEFLAASYQLAQFILK